MMQLPRAILHLFGWLFSLGFTLLIIGIVTAVLLYNHYSRNLPDYTQLAHYDPPTVTRLYAADGKLLAEYATEKRIFVPLPAIPLRVREAFISAEDKNFYENEGIDFAGILRALRDDIVNYGQGHSLVGGSTITQQVVKNFLLTREKSLERKVKEAVLAMRISHVYSKDKILELYLNEIYLGEGAYGVAAAAQKYFNKSMDELTIAEAALLAAQPKAPALYDPRKSYNLALARRNWVIDRMRDGGYIAADDAEEAKKTLIVLRTRNPAEIAHADYFAEEVRRELSDMYGASALYEGGLMVKTTLDPHLQKYADDALRKALIEYDRRRGYRGALARMPAFGAKVDDWKERLVRLEKRYAYELLDNQKLALVTATDDRRAIINFSSGGEGTVPLSLLKWTRRVIADGQLGPEIRKPADVLKVGDVVIVGPTSAEEKKLLTAAQLKKAWDLEQIPEVNGAMIVLDPHTGRVLAMSGGYAYDAGFDRATQARRQPGSSFKPFIYTAGLENGFTPTTVLVDGPVTLSQGPGLPDWTPENYKDTFLGPITMRRALEDSRNTWTVRLAQIIGIKKAREIGTRFGIYDALPPEFSIVLGSQETTLIRLANAYGILDNGGERIMPSLIERIDDRHGHTIYRRDSRICTGCAFTETPSTPGADAATLKAATAKGAADEQAFLAETAPPIPPDDRPELVDPRVDYQVVSMLHGVTVRGTGARIQSELADHILAGKTGTTNDSKDTWFIGFTPDLVAGVYIGYDTPRTLGKHETGASVALPAFIDFMKHALNGVPNKPFRQPPGIQLIKVDYNTGIPIANAPPTSPVIDEAFVTGGPIFIPGVTPPQNANNNDNNNGNPQGGVLPPPLPVSPGAAAVPVQEAPPVVGTGGLY